MSFYDERHVDFTGFSQMLPESITIDKEILYSLKYSIENGIEYSKEYLKYHDNDFGRTTKKNKQWAETIEKDIEQMKNCLNLLAKNL